MTASFINTSVRVITLSILSLVSIASVLSPYVRVSAQDSRPPAITRSEVKVPSSTEKPFTVYFEYGSSIFDRRISNVVATATIINTQDQSRTPSFEFVSNDEFQNFDIFDGDPSRGENDPTPRVALPCDTFDGPRYRIPDELFSTTAMNRYGLQTAKNGAQETAILAKGSTGCIALQVALTSDAEVGDRAAIQFDWDSGPSPDLLAEQRPNILIQPLLITQGEVVSSSSVSSSSISSSSSVSSSSSSSSIAPAPVVTRTGGGSSTYYILGAVSFVLVSALVISRKREPQDM